MSKKNQIKLQFIKTVKFSADRGKAKNCTLCLKEFTMLTREHQCKRCKRPVCENCSPHKAVVSKYDDNKVHRHCNFCKVESDEMKKFISDNKIALMNDTYSVHWLQAFDLDLETAQKDYDQAQQEAKKSKEDSEIGLMNQSISTVLQEIDVGINYSLSEFYGMVISKKGYGEVATKILTVLLQKFPEIGWSADLVVITQFLLCFASESATYMLLTIIYGSIIPSYLYNRTQRTKPYDYHLEMDMIQKLMDQGFRLQTPEANAMKFLFQSTVSKYVPGLGLNFFLFETQFFLINQMFLGGQKGYDELIKGVTSIVSTQVADIKKLSVKYDEAELLILRNVRANQTSVQFVQLKAINFDQMQQARSKQGDNIMARSVSLAHEKQQAQIFEKEGMKVELLTLRQKIESMTTQNEELTQDLFKAQNERKMISTKFTLAEEEIKKLKDEHYQLLEEIQTLRVEKIKRDQQSQDTSKSDELTTQLSEKLMLLQAENNSNKNQLDEERQQSEQLRLQVEQLKKQLETQKSNQNESVHKLIEKDSEILKLKQELEMLAIMSTETNQTVSESSSNNSILIESKNKEINELTVMVKDLQLENSTLKERQIASQIELERINSYNRKVKEEVQVLQQEIQSYRINARTSSSENKGSASMGDIIKSLEDTQNIIEKKNEEIIKLKRQIKEQEERIEGLNKQVEESQKEMQQYAQINEDFNQIMRRASTDNQGDILTDDFDILLKDQDPVRRNAARNIKNKVEALEKEVLFRQTEAEIKKEQLQPFKDKVKSQEAELEGLKKRVKELEDINHRQKNMIQEYEAEIQAQREKIEASQIQMHNNMIKPRNNLSDKDVLGENRQTCSGKDESCVIM